MEKYIYDNSNGLWYELLGVKLFDFVAGHAGDVGLEGEGVGLGFV